MFVWVTATLIVHIGTCIGVWQGYGKLRVAMVTMVLEFCGRVG